MQEKDKKERKGVGEHDQSTLYACMKISQWNTFLKLVYDNKNYFSKRVNTHINGEWTEILHIIKRDCGVSHR
jgi:hypothetical protein